MYEKIDKTNFAHFELLYNKYINEPIGINGHKLVCRIASHLLSEIKEKDCDILSDPFYEESELKDYVSKEPFVNLREFYSKYQMCESTIGALLFKDKRFFEFCAKKDESRYYIQPLKALYYLSHKGSGKMQSKVKRILEKLNKEEEKCL